jgi:CheY-like chemotaxis protein
MNSAADLIHFLIVDDLEENLVALEALLRRDGLSILRARSGEEALELLLRHEIALALLDV